MKFVEVTKANGWDLRCFGVGKSCILGKKMRGISMKNKYLLTKYFMVD